MICMNKMKLLHALEIKSLLYLLECKANYSYWRFLLFTHNKHLNAA